MVFSNEYWELSCGSPTLQCLLNEHLYVDLWVNLSLLTYWTAKFQGARMEYNTFPYCPKSNHTEYITLTFLTQERYNLVFLLKFWTRAGFIGTENKNHAPSSAFRSDRTRVFIYLLLLPTSCPCMSPTIHESLPSVPEIHQTRSYSSSSRLLIPLPHTHFCPMFTWLGPSWHLSRLMSLRLKTSLDLWI